MNTLSKKANCHWPVSVPVLLAGLCTVSLTPPVHAAQYKILARFQGEGFTHNSAVPLIQGTNHFLVGTAPRGASYGEIFMIDPSSPNSRVYFAFRPGAIKYPQGGLMLGGDGLYYGTTEPLRTPTKTPQMIFDFNGDMNTFDPVLPLVEGWKMLAPPIWAPEAGDSITDSVPVLYGVASDSRGGAVFRLVAARGMETFPLNPNSTGSDPQGPLRVASDGNLYGTAQSGGKYALGTVFALQVNPSTNLSKVYDFCRDQACGGSPNGPLVLGWDGALYGTTREGGDQGHGTVFRLVPGQPAQFIHSFDDKNQGWKPSTGLVLGSDGKLYGTTSMAGPNNNNCGTMFSLSPDSRLAPTAWTFKVEHAFTPKGGCAPTSQPVLHSNGRIYGMTTGPAKAVLYELDVGAKPTIVAIQQGAKRGATIGILGQGLSSATQVIIGKLPARFQVNDDVYMSVTVPNDPDLPALSDITVSLKGGGDVTAAAPFVVFPNSD